jgi:hypothetical protein
MGLSTKQNDIVTSFVLFQPCFLILEPVPTHSICNRVKLSGGEREIRSTAGCSLS